MTPTPYRISADDTSDLDAKVRDGIQPVLDALGITINDVVNILTAGVGSDNLADEVKTVQLQVDTLAAAFPFRFSTKVKRPTLVVLGNCQPREPTHTLAVPFVMQGFSVTDTGQISIPAITGILDANSYSLTFWIR